MLRYVIGLLFLLGGILTADAGEPQGTCWVAAIAMNQDPEFSEDWNQYAEEAALVFSNQSGQVFADVKFRTVLGRQATLRGMEDAVRWAFTSARKGDLVVVYLTCHGGTTRKEGWGIDTMDGQLVYGRDLKMAAAQVACPVIFLIDSCESGGFAREHKRDVALPDNCVAFCSSRARQSTTNVLNIAFHEALWGAGDTNDDGFVQIDELKQYVESRSLRLSPKAEDSQKAERPVVVIGSQVDGTLRLTKRSEELVAVVHEREWHLARVVKSAIWASSSRTADESVSL